MWNKDNLANWENEKKSSSELWEKEVLKIILAFCLYIYRKKEKLQSQFGLDFGEFLM